jgi:hypothetical protein
MKKGFALALTLWIVAMMSLASVMYLSYGKRTVDKIKKLEQKLQAIFESESTLEIIKFYGMTGEFSSNKINNALLSKIFPAFPKEIFIDNRKVVWGKQTILLQDTAGLIGSSDVEALSNYLIFNEKVSKDKKVIIRDSIKDWLDEDNRVSLNGAERLFYQSRGYNYSPRNQTYLASIDEFFLLRGFFDSNINKSRFKSKLVKSNYVFRNVLTMDLIVLSQVYELSKIETEQLKKAKQESIDIFFKLFYKFKPEVFNRDGTGATPSRIVKVTIIFNDKDIREKLSLLISFRLGSSTASEVLEYNN